jgi:hypothetical protein
MNHRPWLGYFLLLEKHGKSISPVKVKEPHFKVFKNFKDTSYKDRYQIFCEKLLRERLYDAVCLLMSDRASGLLNGTFEESVPDIGFKVFCEALVAKIIV